MYVKLVYIHNKKGDIMPWILLPIIFLFSISLHFVDKNIFTDTVHILFNQNILIPLSIYLGLKYKEKGVLVLGIGLILLFLPYRIPAIQITDTQNFLYLNDIVGSIRFKINQSFYIFILAIASISAYYPEFFKVHHSKLNRIPMLNIYLLIPLGLIVVIGGDFSTRIVLSYFAYLLLFFIGLFEKRNNFIYIFVLLLFLHIINIVIFNTNTSIGLVKISFIYKSTSTFIAMLFAYLIGVQYSKNLKRDTFKYTKLEYLKLLILVLFLFIFISFNTEMQWLRSLFRGSPISYSIVFVAIYIGLRYQKNGLYIALIWSIISMIILAINGFNPKNTIIVNDYVRFIPIISFQHYIYILIFVLSGYLATKIKSNFDSYDKYLIKSVSAKNIRNLYIFLILFFPIIILVGFLIQVSTQYGDFGKALIQLLLEGRENKVYLVIFFGIMAYLAIIYIPILLSEGIIKRNGVIFNQENFPQYKKVHDILDEDFGYDRRDLYLISPNRIVLWGGITARAFKIYSALNPALLSPTFNEITKYGDEQLLYLVYRQHTKIKLGHVKLWWYMYILTFIPILNVLYFYAKRLTYQNATLYTIDKLTKRNLITIGTAIDAIVTEETEAGVQNISKDAIRVNGLRNIFFLWFEYLTSRPHLQTQLYLVKSFDKLKSNITIQESKLGYNFS